MENSDIFNLNVVDSECDLLALKDLRRSQVQERALISACLGKGYTSEDLQALVTETNREICEEIGEDAEFEKAPVEKVVEAPAEEIVEEVAAEEPVVEETVEEPVAEEPVVEQSPAVEAKPVDEESEEEEKEIRREGSVLFEISYNWSFRARLLNAGDDMKERYNELYNIFMEYGLKLKESWKKARVFEKGITYVQLLFKGKTLCVAFALDPNEYEETKFVFENVGRLKNYIATPMLVRITSDRQMRNVKELLSIMFADRIIKDVTPVTFDLPYKTKMELVKEGGIKEVKNIVKEG